jgi:RimJ/RimL family protein N-acetyltransferase
MPFPDSFTTARLQAERLTPDHLHELRRLHTDPDVMRHIGGLRNEAQSVDYLGRNLKHWNEHGFGLWILRELRGGAVIGTAVLRHLLIEGIDEVEVGYAFYKPFWGRGLATEIARVCLGYGHDMLRLPTIVGVTSLGNIASQHVLEKAGLVYEREFTLDGEQCSLFRTKGAST